MIGTSHVYSFRRDEDLFLFAEGRLTATAAYTMFRHIERLGETFQVQAIHLDVNKTSYIDSTALGVFLKLHKMMAGVQGSFLIVNPSADVEQILKDCHLLGFFEVVSEQGLSGIRSDLASVVERDHNDLLSTDFVIERHLDILDAAPELAPQFKAVFSALQQEKRSSG
jgi:anti-anti-sigma factor